MGIRRTSIIFKAGLFSLSAGLLFAPINAGASGDKGDKSKTGVPEGLAWDNGSGGSVPVNGGIAFLTLAGVAYCASKFYALQKKQLAIA